MKNLRYFVFICLFGVLLGRAQSISEIEWKSWSELEHSIKEESKPIFIFFYAKWCSYCKKIEKEIAKLYNDSVHLQRNGDLRSYGKVMFKIQNLEEELDKLSRNEE